MLFRPLGSTGLSLSVIGLGGHWRTQDGRRYDDRFVDDEVPAGILRNRTEVVAACLGAGINYLDVTTGAEALAYGRVLTTCRDRFIIGADDYQWSARSPECCNSRALTANVERCLSRLQTDYLDIWRVTAEVHGRNTDAEIESVIEAADRLRESGKIRFLGISSHHPGWIRTAVTRFPEFKIAIVPCTPLTCGPSPLPPEPLRTIAERGLGVMTIKPFAGGMLFEETKERGSFGEPARPRAGGPRAEDRPARQCLVEDSATDPVENHRLARFALQYILQSRPEITCVLAGMTTVQEVNAAVDAVTAPPLNDDEKNWLESISRDRLHSLPPEYAWLHQWHDR